MSDIQRVKSLKEGEPRTGGVQPVSAVEEAEAQLHASIPRAASSEAAMPIFSEYSKAQLSETGKVVAEDIAKVAQDTKVLVEERLKPATEEASSKVGHEFKVREELEALLSGIGTGKEDWSRVARLLVTSKEFREMLLDFTGIFQEAFRDYRFEYEQGDQPKKEEAGTGVEQLEAKLKGTEIGVGETTGKKKHEIGETYMVKIVDRFGEFVEKARVNRDCKEAFGIILSNIKSFDSNVTLAFKEPSDMTSEEKDRYESIKETDLTKLLIAGRAFIERWINASLSPVIKSFDNLRLSIGKDQVLKEKLSALGDWFRSALESDKPVNKDQLKANLLELRGHLTDDYRGQLEHLTGETKFVAKRLQSDEITMKLTSDVNDLVNHLFRDEHGSLTIKPELWGDLKNILPTLLGRMRFIQIPELVIKDASVDFRATGVALNVGEIAPKRLQAHFYTDADTDVADVLEAQEYDLQTIFIIEAGKIYAEARNVYFEFDRHSFPPLTDSGIADLAIHGDEGMSLRLTFGARRQAVVGNLPLATGLKLLRAKCEIDELDLRFHETKHSWMYTVLGPLIRRQLRLRIQEDIEKYFMSGDWLESIASPSAIAEAMSQSVTQ